MKMEDFPIIMIYLPLGIFAIFYTLIRIIAYLFGKFYNPKNE
jgi:hypothetical protein